MKKNIILFLLVWGAIPVFSQKNVKDSVISTSMIRASYNMSLPSGNLDERFGLTSSVGLGYTYKTKTNLLLEFDFNYLFGSDVKEDDILQPISTSQGFVIDRDGSLAEIRMYERGIHTGFSVGRLFFSGKPNPNSGVTFKLGVGFLSHRIRIEDIGNNSPQLLGDYKKGYDRLTGGLSLTQFAGYTYLGNNRKVNFYAGLEVTEGFTKSMRSFDYDKMKADTENRIDILYGVRAGWILPLYKRAARDYYFN